MEILHQVGPQGHFITIRKDNIELTVKTREGLAAELALEAEEMRDKAARLLRNAGLIEEALVQGL